MSPLLRECPDQHEALLDIEVNLTCQEADSNSKEAREAQEQNMVKAPITTHFELPRGIRYASMEREIPEKDYQAVGTLAFDASLAKRQIGAEDQVQQTTRQTEAADAGVCSILATSDHGYPAHTEKSALCHQVERVSSLAGNALSGDDLVNGTDSGEAHVSEYQRRPATGKQPTLKEQIQRELARRSANVDRSDVTQMTTKQLKEYRAAQALAGGA